MFPSKKFEEDLIKSDGTVELFILRQDPLMMISLFRGDLGQRLMSLGISEQEYSHTRSRSSLFQTAI